jgi:hypothetical protein
MNPEQLIGAHSRPRVTRKGPLIMSHFDRFAGIGIAKNRLDVYRRPDGLAFVTLNAMIKTDTSWNTPHETQLLRMKRRHRQGRDRVRKNLYAATLPAAPRAGLCFAPKTCLVRPARPSQ